MEATLASRLNHYQHTILCLFFDQVEDSLNEIVDDIIIVAIHKNEGKAQPQQLVQWTAQVRAKVGILESYCEAETAFLKKEGVPYEVTVPISIYAARKIKRVAVEHLGKEL